MLCASADCWLTSLLHRMLRIVVIERQPIPVDFDAPDSRVRHALMEAISPV